MLKKIVLATCLTLAAAPALQAQSQLTVPQTLTVEHGGQTRTFQVSLSEVYELGPDGRATIRPVAAASLNELTDQAKQSSSSNFILTDASGARYFLSQQVLVQAGAGRVFDLAKKYNATVEQLPVNLPGYYLLTIQGPGAALGLTQALQGESGVTAAQPVLGSQMALRRTGALTIDDPMRPLQWHLDAVNADGAWGLDVTGDGVSIAIVDDGVMTAHPDLAENVDPYRGYNWVGVPTNNPNPHEFDDHGTACAGIAAGRGGNGEGITGLAPESWIVPHRLLSTAASQPGEVISANPLFDQNICHALVRSLDIIDVSNNSWGPADDGRTLLGPGLTTHGGLKLGVTEGRDRKGIIYVWAGGDGAQNGMAYDIGSTKVARRPLSGDNSNKDGYANSIYTIAVGAVTEDVNTGELVRAPYSERGANLIVVAPSNGGLRGVTTTTLPTIRGNGYRNDFGGTSAAAPVVSGVVALMLEKNPDLTWRDVQEILIQTANRTALPDDGEWMRNNAGLEFNPNYGAGLVDAQAAVALASDWSNLPPQMSQSKSVTFETALGIPDSPREGVLVPFDFLRNVDPLMRVEHATVTINLEHDFRGDLDIELISPWGTVSHLTELSGDDNDDYKNWTFMTVVNWGERSIADEGMNGRWWLRITDRSDEGVGELLDATLTLFGTPAPEAAGLTVTYPGDANADGTVDEMDFFFAASVLGQVGDPRKDQGIQFRGYAATEWSRTADFQGKKIDLTHVDANGDGVINLDDLSVTIIHRGKKRD